MDRTFLPVPEIPHTSQSPIWLGLTFFVVAVLASLWFVYQVTRLGEALEHRHGLALVQTAAALLDAKQISALRAQPDEAGTPAHEAVRGQLRSILLANPEFRFVYLMRPVADADVHFVFLADAEDRESADYSAPGDVYSGPTDYLRLTTQSGQPQFSGLVEDDWGSWVTALAPIYHGGQLVALLGVDLPHDSWMGEQHRYRTFAMVIAGLVLALIAIFLLALQLQRRAAQRAAVLGQQLAQRLYELEQAQEGLRLAEVVVHNTSEAIMLLDPAFRVLRVNAAYERLSGLRAEDVLGKPPAALTQDPVLAKRVYATIASGDHWEEEHWVDRPDGSRYPVRALVEAVRDDNDVIEHFIVVLENLSSQKELEERLRELSATDGLTGIANRRSFDEGLAREWERAIRQDTSLSVVMTDIDFFKHYNDNYGHVAGDVCLQRVAAALKSGVRQGGDLVARYGGEEFAALLPGANAEAARLVAESLRACIETLGLPHAGNPAIGVVTISLGVATMHPTHGTQATSLVELADRQLYRAKADGRNRVES